MNLCDRPRCNNKIFQENGIETFYRLNKTIKHNGKCRYCHMNLCDKHKINYYYDDDCGGSTIIFV